MIELQVTRERAGLRLDRYLALELSDFSRSRLQTLIENGFVRLNEQEPRTRELVRTGDVVQVTVPPLEKIEAAAESIPLQILFEDDDLLVLNKAAGMVVHPGAGNQEHTLVNALLSHCRTLSGIGGKERPGIVHRLDKETSGCLVVAKNDQTHRELSRQFAARTMKKTYLAIVAGRLKKKSGTIDAPIARHPIHRQRMSIARSTRGRSAVTEYEVLRSGAEMSLVQCALHSGRTHQIRVHLHHLGHPVIGDKLYAPKLAKKFPRQMLHAWKLGFTHPRTGEWNDFEAPLPEDFSEVLATLSSLAGVISDEGFGDRIGEQFSLRREKETALALMQQTELHELSAFAGPRLQPIDRNAPSRAKRKRDLLRALGRGRERFGRDDGGRTGADAVAVDAIIGHVLPPLAAHGRERTWTETEVIIARPIAAIMRGFMTGPRVIRDLVLPITGSFEHAHGRFEKERVSLHIGAVFAPCLPQEKFRVFLVGQAIGRDVLGREGYGSLEGRLPLRERLAR